MKYDCPTDVLFAELETLCAAWWVRRIAMSRTYRVERQRAHRVDRLAEAPTLNAALRDAVAVLRVEREERTQP